MSAVKFVHILKRIENLERDINEIQALQSEINGNRSYSTPVKISLEQQVNNLLNEKVKLMEVRIENPPEHLDPNKKTKVVELENQKVVTTFEALEQSYYEKLTEKRGTKETYNNSEETFDSILEEKETLKTATNTQIEKKALPSLAQKSLVKGESKIDDEQNFLKKRTELLKDLPPLEY